MKAGYLDTPLPFRDLAKVFPIISENRLPLLTENNFQIHPFYLDPLAYWYGGYPSDPPPSSPTTPIIWNWRVGGRRSSRFPWVKPVVKSSLGRVTFITQSNINDGAPLRKQPMDLTRWLLLQKEVHRRPPFGFQLRIRLEVLQFFFFLGGGLRLHGISSSRLVYKKVVEVPSNYISYKKSYFWWFGNPATRFWE